MFHFVHRRNLVKPGISKDFSRCLIMKKANYALSLRKNLNPKLWFLDKPLSPNLTVHEKAN